MSLFALFRLLSRLPLSYLHGLGSLLGWLVWLCSPLQRRLVRENLSTALGHAPDSALVRVTFKQMGCQLFELPFIWLRPQAEILRHIVQVQGQDVFDRAKAQGGSLLILTPHLGCFELVAQYCATQGLLTVLFRPPRQAALNPIMEAGRQRGNIRLASADLSGVRRLIKALRNGEMVGMLPDQVPAAGAGIWAPFFGRPAWTMTLAGRLSEVRGVRLLLVWAERLPRGAGYTVHVHEPVEALIGSLPERCALINREIERLILSCPGQYLWAYRRYKCPKGVEPLQEGQ